MTTSPPQVLQRSMRPSVPARCSPVGARTGTFALVGCGCLAIALGASTGRLGGEGALVPAITILRIASVLGGAYLVGVIAVGAFVRIVRAPARVTRVVDRATPSAVRRLLDLSLATGLVMSATAIGASAFPLASTAVPRPTLAGRPATAGDPSSGQRWPTLPDPPGTSPSAPNTAPSIAVPPVTAASIAGPPVTGAPRPTSLNTAVPTPTPSSRSTAVASPSAPLRATAPAEQIVANRTAPNKFSPPSLLNVRVARAPSGPAVPPAAEHLVSAGESFWSIAEDHVLALDPHAGEAPIAAYWNRLQHANLDRMPVKGQPDMLYAGIHLRLPDVVSPRRPPPADGRTSQAQ